MEPTEEELKAARDAEVKKLAEQLAADQLKDIKAKLDESYARRDAAEKQAADLAAASRQAEIKALEDAGKTTEAMQRRLDDQTNALAAANAKLIAYERDGLVIKHLDSVPGLEFASPRAREIAMGQINAVLTQDKDGKWLHRTGLDVQSFVKTFVSDPENAFLLKPKTNQGAGLPSGASGGTLKKPMKDMTTQELLEAAQSGLLGG
jgi:hypothetical protein